MAMHVTAGLRLAGRYELERQLGRGGMGAVWLARDVSLGRAVAVKLVDSDDPAHRRAQGRLRREALAMGSLTHPQVAQVYDYCETDDGAFIVMELIDGESLSVRLSREGRLSAAESVRIAALCAEALDAAHRAGLVHRDVKPSNIMLTGDNAKVVDFGIAASLEPTEATTAFGMFGTVAYLAPERATGATVTPASDLYALGVVLYQMLAGHLPFNAEESMAMLYAHTAASPLPMPSDVPPDLVGICLDLLAKDPAARPASAFTVAARLKSASVTTPVPYEMLWLPEPDPVGAEPDPAPARRHRRHRRHSGPSQRHYPQHSELSV